MDGGEAGVTRLSKWSFVTLWVLLESTWNSQISVWISLRIYCRFHSRFYCVFHCRFYQEIHTIFVDTSLMDFIEIYNALAGFTQKYTLILWVLFLWISLKSTILLWISFPWKRCFSVGASFRSNSFLWISVGLCKHTQISQFNSWCIQHYNP